jgi:hypothetical protein
VVLHNDYVKSALVILGRIDLWNKMHLSGDPRRYRSVRRYALSLIRQAPEYVRAAATHMALNA